ncbi:MAG: accessory factor UbiK family protein [Gammaproteobacteria bacterium]
MFSSKTFDTIADRINNAIPPGISTLKIDMERNMHALLQSALSKLDLVSREEFEVQKAVLVKTRARLESLEKRVEELEKHLALN